MRISRGMGVEDVVIARLIVEAAYSDDHAYAHAAIVLMKHGILAETGG